MNQSTAAASGITAITEQISKASKLADREAADVDLIAISKTRSADEIRPLLREGHRSFGENRVQEAQEKWPALKEEFPDVRLHMVGQLQSNKAREAVQLFDSIHSLDRPSLVKALAKAMDQEDRQLPCFVQVNIGEEAQKGGCAISELSVLLDEAKKSNLLIEGLMCVPPAGVNAAPYFALLAKLAKENRLSQLSMGMSADFETAIKMGATHIRVGTALFGERQP